MNIFITGITGTLGTVVSRRLRELGHNVWGMTRDEHKSKRPDGDNYHIGDIRDRDRVVELTKDIDVLYHFAALKHVDLMELETGECIKTNLLGTQNILHAQNENRIRKVVFTSTDKAVYPINIYGQCKAISEKLVLNNAYENTVCRYGNVFSSNGSVVHTFGKQIHDHKKIFVTDKTMTRFWISIEDAANFVLECGLKPTEPWGVYIPKMKACAVVRIANAVIEQFNLEDTIPIEEVGLRPGEKLKEHLKRADEKVKGFYSDHADELNSNNADILTQDEIKKMVSGVVWSC